MTSRRWTPSSSADEPRPNADPAAREPDWSGWATVERVCAEYGVSTANLVKPGIGETTRVLLRRVPWRVLVRPDRHVFGTGTAADLERAWRRMLSGA